MKRVLTVCLLTLMVLTSCSWFGVQKEESAEELANEGMEEFNSGNYRMAVQVFHKLKDWYPFSKYAILAELKIADGLYKLRQFEQAIYAYEKFEGLHPRNEATPYVVNQIGLSHFGRVDTIDRDQVSARMALMTFKRLIKQFPDSLYAQKAKENLIKCQKSLAGHELEVGIFYYKSKHYRAAINRFKTVVTDYPDVGSIHHQALQFIDLSEQALRRESSEG